MVAGLVDDGVDILNVVVVLGGGVTRVQPVVQTAWQPVFSFNLPAKIALRTLVFTLCEAGCGPVSDAWLLAEREGGGDVLLLEFFHIQVGLTRVITRFGNFTSV